MRKAMLSRTAVVILVAAILPPATAMAQSEAAPARGRVTAKTPGLDQGHVVLRRDGSRAVPFVPRSGPTTATASSGFHWGDAAFGAAAGIALMLLGSAATLGRRRRATLDATLVGSRSATRTS